MSPQLSSSPLTSTSVSPFRAYGGQTIWFPVIALISFGLLFVYSASSVYASQKFGNEFLFVKRQLIYVLPGVLFAYLGAKISLNFLSRHCGKIFLLCVALVFLTKAPYLGKSVKGAARWIALGPLQVQPSEFLKISTILFAAFVLHRHPAALHRFWPIGLALLGLLLQPDFGSTMILCAGLAGILFFHGLPKRIFFGTFALFVPLAVGVMIAEPYRVRRLVTFLDPFADPLGAGFQVIQSFVSIASGGLFGKGLGGSQQKLFFLPEAHTDFILAVMSEEMGFVGVLTIALIFGLLFYSLLQVVVHAPTRAERLIAAGFFTMIASSTLVNMGVVAGLLPTKGLPLPFVSAGGSSLLANLFMIGMLSRIHKNILTGQTAAPRQEEKKDGESCFTPSAESTL
jgi:cell division protein FtsW